jgi:formylmethanofuran dehydrogenase subunit E
MNPKSARAWAAFHERVKAQGGEVLEQVWLGARVGHRIRCPKGHEHTPMPSNIQRGGGICLTCAGQDPHEAWIGFKSRVEGEGGVVLEPVWLGASVRHRIRCAAGHETTANPNTVQQGGGVCRRCSGLDPEVARLAFHARVQEQGSEVLDLRWGGVNKRHRVRCAAGHETTAYPSKVRVGGGICGTCASNNTEMARAAFYGRVSEQGGTVLDREWFGVDIRYRVRCAAGHETKPLPRSVQQGGGICRVCSGRDAASAWKDFRALIEALGGKVLEPEWLGSGAAHRVLCAKGHPSTPTPGNVKRRKSFCDTCAGQDSAAAWAAFQDRVEERGSEVLETEWLGSGVPHRVLCAEGHETTVYPNNVRDQGGVCRVCTGHDPEAAWGSFRALVAEVGGVVVEPRWLGANTRHRIRCAYGHETAPYPTLIQQQGGGVCRVCSGRTFDVFYVLQNPKLGRLKFGITSHTGRARLRTHRKAGYSTELLVRRKLPQGSALEVENAVKAALRRAHLEPAHGTEYFDIAAAPIVLRTAERHLSEHGHAG